MWPNLMTHQIVHTTKENVWLKLYHLNTTARTGYVSLKHLYNLCPLCYYMF